MKIISAQQIAGLAISPVECLQWIEYCFRIKYNSVLPPKISIHAPGEVFFNTMPCYLPAPESFFGAKLVSRFPNRTPALQSEILLYDATSGERKAKQDEFDQQYGRDDRVERLGIVPVDRYVFYGGNIQPEIDENAEIRDDRLCEYGQSVVTRSDCFQHIRQRDKRHCHPDDLDDGEVSRIFDNGFVILYFLEDHFECCVKPKI